jgi:putative membrane protein
MAYCGAFLFRKLTKYKLVNAFVAGTAITLLDLIMEPVAIHLDFWTWEGEGVPLQNYLTWGTAITLFSLLIYGSGIGQQNKISNWVLGAQVFFFAAILLGITL